MLLLAIKIQTIWRVRVTTGSPCSVQSPIWLRLQDTQLTLRHTLRRRRRRAHRVPLYISSLYQNVRFPRLYLYVLNSNWITTFAFVTYILVSTCILNRVRGLQGRVPRWRCRWRWCLRTPCSSAGRRPPCPTAPSYSTTSRCKPTATTNPRYWLETLIIVPIVSSP